MHSTGYSSLISNQQLIHTHQTQPIQQTSRIKPTH
nr:MAG TPA: hypothetical protein [Caudoviricetes sp.]